MRQIVILAYHELTRLLRHRAVLLLLFVMPLLIILILGTALSAEFSGHAVRTGQVRLAVLMEDHGFIRPSLDQYLADGTGLELQVKPAANREQLEELLQGNAADAGLLLPAGFSEALRSGSRPVWEFQQGGSVMKSVAARQALESFFDQWSLRYAASGAWSGGSGSNMSNMQAFETNQGTEAAQLMKRTGWNGTDASYSAMQYYSAHMLVMYMLYCGMSSAISMVGAKEDHTLMRLRSMPVPAWQLMIGSVAGHSVVVLLQAGVVIFGSALLFGTDWGTRPDLLFCIVLLVMLCAQSLGVLAACLLRKKRFVIGLFQGLIILSTFLAGGFSPAVGEAVSRLGTYTLNHWASDSMLRLMLQEEPAAVAERIRHLAWFAAAGVLSAILVYRKAGYHE